MPINNPAPISPTLSTDIRARFTVRNRHIAMLPPRLDARNVMPDVLDFIEDRP